LFVTDIECVVNPVLSSELKLVLYSPSDDPQVTLGPPIQPENEGIKKRRTSRGARRRTDC